MTRIIGGIAGGRRLAVPPRGTRPTSDRVREALFNSLDHHIGEWQTCRVLDLYAGSGALGLEAASRGAEHVLMVEQAAAAVAIIKANIEAVGVGTARVHSGEVTRLAASTPPAVAMAPYSLVLLDPPYDVAAPAVGRVLTTLGAHGWLEPDALVVVERSARDDWAWPEGFAAIRERRYGDTALWFGEKGPA